MRTVKDDDIRKVYEPLAKDHERLRTELMNTLAEQASPRQPEPRQQRVRSVRRFAGAAVAASVLLALALLGVFGNGKHNIAWADVVESFKSVTFFHATLYQQEEALTAPVKTDLWMGHGGKLRICSGTQVAFGGSGKIAKYYDVKRRAECDPAEIVGALLEEDAFGSQKNLSIDTVIRMFGNNASVSPPIVNEEASISEDMTVFDVTTDRTPEVVRIWTLRTSKLPVRIRVWDPRDGEAIDAFFSYAEPQPVEFFDATRFEKTLQDRNKEPRDLVNALMQDPAGRALTQQDVFEDAGGYHIPVIEQVGITEDGAVWVIAGKATNRKPAGGPRTFYGFQVLEDDLGRSYHRAYSSHAVAGDRSAQVFIPPKYPFDERVPNTLTFTCQTVEYDDRKVPELIGKEIVTQWQQGGEWPGQFRTCSPRTSQAHRLLGEDDWETLERLLETIPGNPETSRDALTRESLRLSMFMKQKAYNEAVSLAENLQPLYEKDYLAWHGSAKSPGAFNNYIIALACLGRIEDAQKVFKRVQKLTPNIPNDLNRRAQRKIREHNKESVVRNIQTLASRLSWKAHLSVEEIGDFLGVDIKNDKRFDHFSGWDWNAEYKKPIYDIWREHLKKLAKHYEKHPLPKKMEILPREKHDKFYNYTKWMPGIRTHEVESLSNRTLYSYVYEWNGSPNGLVKMPRELQKIKMDHDLVHAVDVSRAERQAFLLDHFGYEVKEVIEPCQVMVGRYDGRPLKSYRAVKAPVPYPGKGNHGPGMAIGWGTASMTSLLDHLMRYQPVDLGRRLVVVDETGIKSIPDREGDWASVAVSCENPTWTGDGGLEMARKWFEEEFGVTFTEETRPFKVHIVSKKAR